MKLAAWMLIAIFLEVLFIILETPLRIFATAFLDSREDY